MYMITLLIIATLVATSLASIYKVEDAKTKEEIRKELNDSSYKFLSNKGIMAIFYTVFISPLFFYIKWDTRLLIIVIILAIMRFIPWVGVNYLRGKYKNTTHQASSNFTMLENFAGPLGALLIYGIVNSINSNVALGWYILSPMIGIFLLWALRAREESINIEMLLIIAIQAILVAIETGILLYIKNISFEVEIPKNLYFIKKEIFLFMIIIGVSSFMSGIYFTRDIISDYKKGVIKKSIYIGFLSGIHDIVYFISFSFFGPIFLIARRGLLIPSQNLYLEIKKGKKIIILIWKPLKVPLLELKGGKDFIISFTDLVFNRVIKVIINLS